MAVWTRTRGRMMADPGLVVAFAAVGALLVLFVLYPAVRVLIYPRLADYPAIPDNPRWLQAARDSLLMMGLSIVPAPGAPGGGVIRPVLLPRPLRPRTQPCPLHPRRRRCPHRTWSLTRGGFPLLA